MEKPLFTFNRDNPDMPLYVGLKEAAIGFLSNCAILHDEFENKKNKDVAEYMRLQTPYSSNLLQSIELLLKVILLSEGYGLDKLRTHKIYDLYKKLRPETQKYLKLIIDGSGTHYYSLESILKDNNNKFTRLRYNDLTQSSLLTFNGSDVLLHLGLFLCESTGFKITKHGKVWKPK
ncbi:MAG: hypothetical protein ACK5N8_01805 [Alphaproteobacteria bacterium]